MLAALRGARCRAPPALARGFAAPNAGKAAVVVSTGDSAMTEVYMRAVEPKAPAP
jgi:hypothetical protein